MMNRFSMLACMIFMAPALLAQWTIVDTFAYHQQWLYPVEFHLRPVSDGCLYYFYTANPSPSSESQVRVYGTVNDGQDWAMLLSYFDYSYQAHDLEAPDPDTVFFTYRYMSYLNLLRSTDSGSSWTTVNYVDGPEDICFLSGSQGYGIRNKWFMRYENDTLQVVDTLEWYLSHPKVGFGSEGAGFIICSKDFVPDVSTVIRTVDDGNTWEIMLEDGQRDFLDLQVPGSSTAYIATEGGCIYRTTDQGENWELLDLGTQADIRSISFLGPGTGYALDDEKVIHYTDDFGVSWTQHELPGIIDGVRTIKMINDTVGYVHAIIAGYEQLEVLLKTQNGGITPVEEAQPWIEGVKIFPSPFCSRLHVKYDDHRGEPLELEIYDLQGELRFQHRSWMAPEYVLDLSFLPDGAYLLRIHNKNVHSVFKIIKTG